MRAVVKVSAASEPVAKSQKLKLIEKPRVQVGGKWSLADDPGLAPKQGLPEDPSVTVSFSFVVSSTVRVLDQDLGILPPAKNPGDPSLSRYTVTVPVRSSRAATQISVISRRGDASSVEFDITLESEGPVIVVDPACDEVGIRLEELEGATRPSPEAAGPAIPPAVLFARCARKGQALAIKLWSWAEYRWTELPTGQSAIWKVAPRFPVVSGRLPLYPPSGSTETRKFSLARAGQGHSAVSVIVSHSEVRAPTWIFSASLGPTWSSYHEAGAGLDEIQVSQLGLTGKVQTQFRVSPPHWDMAFNVFGTILPLAISRPEVPKTRWLGVNARVGYQFQLDKLSRNTLSIMPGFYAWSMLVPDGAYGVQNLNGPQIVIAANREQGTRFGRFAMLQRFGGYVKAAIVAAGLNVDPTDNEFAIGGSVTMRFFALPRPLVLSADYSRLRFETEGFSMGLSTFSISLGASIF